MNLRQLVERGDRPFASHPQVGRYFPAASIEDSRRRLARSIERGDGPGVVIGAAGSGKSLLLQVLAAQFREQFDVVLLACTQLCTRRALLQAIHFELGLDYRRRDEGELRLSLLDQLLSGDETTQGLLLLVDEAQALATHLLEELRLLTNLSRGGRPRVRLVLAGLPALEEKLASPELQSFSQRLSARCYLAPLTRTETAQYVRAQLAASTAEADRVFGPTSWEALFSATDGVPRLVNQLCDRALVMAEARQLDQVDAAVIQAAWADLQQLPTAWDSPKDVESRTSATTGVVEFGSLEEKPNPPSPPAVRSSVIADECTIGDDATELDDDEPIAVVSPPIAAVHTPTVPLPPSRPLPPRRPRVRHDRVPDAVDPFADRFEEEELVLDSFATLAGIFGVRTPRVENRRDPGFAHMVQRALDATAKASAPEESKARETKFEEKPTHDCEPDRPTIRLAIVSDSPPTPPVVSRSRPHDALMTSATYTPPTTNFPAAATPEPIYCEIDDEEILVIEDEPENLVGPQQGVRREEYRQLFSRLRHGS